MGRNLAFIWTYASACLTIKASTKTPKARILGNLEQACIPAIAASINKTLHFALYPVNLGFKGFDKTSARLVGGTGREG